MSEAPKAGVKQIAVIINETPTAFCRGTKYEGVKMCFDKNLNVTQWLYPPEKFAETYHADIVKLKTKVDECPICQKTQKVLELRRQNGEQQKIITDSLVTFAYTMLEDLSRQENVPVPEVKIGVCPSAQARTKTCYLYRENIRPEDEGTIWIHPEDIGPTAIAHEFYHYMMKKKGNVEEAGSETKANDYARAKVNEMFPETSEGFNSDSRVFHLTGANSMLEGFFKPLADRMQGLTAADVDEAITPELIATSVETATGVFMPQFAAILANVAIGGAYLGACMMNRVPIKWKKVLMEMSGHHLSRVITLAAPRSFSVVTSQAFDFGKSVSAFDGNSIVSQLVRSPDILNEDMRIASQTIDRITQMATPKQSVSTDMKQKYANVGMPRLDLGISSS
jgi:hypothetical protein